MRDVRYINRIMSAVSITIEAAVKPVAFED